MSTPTPTDLLGHLYAHWIDELGKLGDAPISTELLRLIFDDWHRATAEPEDVTYKSTAIGGVPGILVTPVGADHAQVLVFFHGGGFALGSASSHRKLAGHIAKACGATSFVLDFRRAPEFKFPAQLEDGVAVYRTLLKGHRPEDLTLIGDSAGANLAISTVFELRDAGLPAPSGVIAISPWLNMENNGITIETNDATDFLIAREGLQGNIDRYISGATTPTDPRANPLYREYDADYPRLYITAGDIESLWDDAKRLDKLARGGGVDVTFSVGEGMQHVYPFMAGRHERADQEVQSIAGWYRAGRLS